MNPEQIALAQAIRDSEIIGSEFNAVLAEVAAVYAADAKKSSMFWLKAAKSYFEALAESAP